MINYTKCSNITYIVVRIEFNILILTIKLNLLDTEIRNSKLFDVNKLKIGTPLNVRTNNNIILDTYISAISDTGDNFISITCGNMRIKFIDKLLKERNK